MNLAFAPKPSHYAFQDIEGRKVNEWTVVGYVGSSAKDGAKWLCECSCGTRKIWSTSHINKQMSISCGCKTPSVEECFWNKVDKSGECWPWIGAKDPKGYGNFWISWPPRRCEKSHRVAYWLSNGVWPENLLICHSCDNPSCCRPEHLFLGTAQDNSDDMVGKGRQSCKLSKQDVANIYIRSVADKVSRAQLSREYKVTSCTISLIARGIIWKHVTSTLDVNPPCETLPFSIKEKVK